MIQLWRHSSKSYSLPICHPAPMHVGLLVAQRQRHTKTAPHWHSHEPLGPHVCSCQGGSLLNSSTMSHVTSGSCSFDIGGLQPCGPQIVQPSGGIHAVAAALRFISRWGERADVCSVFFFFQTPLFPPSLDTSSCSYLCSCLRACVCVCVHFVCLCVSLSLCSGVCEG